jgi:ATP-binding cassette, subfamily F, member 3
MISLKNVSLLRGGKSLFQDVNLTFYDKQKIGLIGKNGSGKSSFFALLLNQLQPDSGEINISNKKTIITIDQEIPNSAQNVIDFVIDGDQVLRGIERKLQVAEHSGDGVEIAKLYEEYERVDGYTAKARVKTLLAGLGFTTIDQKKHVIELSGGLQRRLNLARALFVSSDILLLDEPTNHLDLETVVWLEKFLNKYSGLVILISHDRDFLDNVVDVVVEITDQHMESYTGNYSEFERLKTLQMELQAKTYEKQQQQIQHLTKFIDRFKAKASKARQAQSRVKALEKMELVAPIFKTLPFTFEFLEGEECPDTLVSLQKVGFSYALQKIFSNVDLRIDAGMRMGLLGRNGMGKTTLMKMLVGELVPNVGEYYLHNKTKIGYFAQYQLENLNLDASPLDHIKEIDPITPTPKLRAFLGSFNFADSMAVNKIRNFSGGEKARLVLALIVWQKPNLLLLDEPTNHLDLEMREALALALQSYSGAMIIVSHDRYLLRSTVDEFYLIGNNNVTPFVGDLDNYKDWLISNADNFNQTAKVPNENSAQNVKNKKLDKAALQRIEKDLEKLEKRLNILDDSLSNTEIYSLERREDLNKLVLEREKIREKINLLENEWLTMNGNT